jgi:hypothetical protein
VQRAVRSSYRASAETRWSFTYQCPSDEDLVMIVAISHLWNTTHCVGFTYQGARVADVLLLAANHAYKGTWKQIQVCPHFTLSRPIMRLTRTGSKVSRMMGMFCALNTSMWFRDSTSFKTLSRTSKSWGRFAMPRAMSIRLTFTLRTYIR